MKILELFSGTGSVGKVFREAGHHVISLDINDGNHSDRHIKGSILDWDYTEFPKGHFDYIHASPPCDTFSICRKSWIGRKLKAHNGEICTKELILKDQQEIGLPLVNKTLEILEYFNPKYYTIENPQTGDMKNYISLPFTDVDYCRYDFPYKKRTRIWNNFNFKGLLCNKQCGSFVNGRHISNCGHLNKKWVSKMDNFISVNLKQKYRIPPELIKSIMNHLNNLEHEAHTDHHSHQLVN